MDLRDERRAAVKSPAIVRDSRRCAGRPTIAGTRTAVHDVVVYARHRNGDLERVRDECLSHLTVEQLRAAMDWYAEHTEEIEEILRERQEKYERLPLAPTER